MTNSAYMPTHGGSTMGGCLNSCCVSKIANVFKKYFGSLFNF